MFGGGLKDALEGTNVQIVATPSDGYDNAKNLSITQDLLNKYPHGELQGIVAQGPQIYVGAEYAKKQGRSDVLFFGAD